MWVVAARLKQLIGRARCRISQMQMALDVVGIGALNIDYIIKRTLPAEDRKSRTALNEFEGRVEEGTEVVVHDQTILERYLSDIGKLNLDIFYGGSACNTIRALAALKTELSLGYLGIAGQAVDGIDFTGQLAYLNIDSQFVGSVPSEPPGKCLSYVVGTERRLMTYPGANRHFAKYLVDKRAVVVDYLTKTKWIHVTSMFDPDSTIELCRVLEAVKQQCPAITISIDPGFVWVEEQSKDVMALLALADLLFLNQREFESLGRPGGDDKVVVRAIVRLIGDKTVFVVLKRFDLITLLERHRGEDEIIQRHFPTEGIPRESIIDDTGAGDVFAAGCIASRVLPSLKLRDIRVGVELGLQMVRNKLLDVGDKQFSTFPAALRTVTSRIHNEEEKPNMSVPPTKGKVFIVHGRDDKARIEVALLIQNLGLQYMVLADEPGQGQGIMEKLERSTSVNYIVAILTADDIGALKSNPRDLKPRARQNVIFELGFFIAALGRKYHAVLYEEGVELPSDYAGINYIALDPNGAWKMRLGRELHAAGFDVNLVNIR